MTTKTTAKKGTSKKETTGIIAIDNGGYGVKVYTKDMVNPVVFTSAKGLGHAELRLGTTYPEDGHTYHIEYKDKHYFTGLLTNEIRRKLTSFTDTKTTDFFILSALQAVYLYGYEKNYVMTTVPISQYSMEEREATIERLVGTHTLIINGVEKTFEIVDADIAPESATAFWELQPEGKVRWLDLGSRTVGFATTICEDGFVRVIERESGSIEKRGLEIAGIEDEYDEYVSEIQDELNRTWGEKDRIIAFGGGCKRQGLVEALQEVYPNLEVAEDPQVLMVKGLLQLAEQQFGGEE